MSDFDGLRRKFKPTVVRVLFVGESRPVGGTFFYAADSILFFATQQAFAAVNGGCPEGEAFLEFFKAAGYYLDDLCSDPVNKLSKNDREQLREAGVGPLSERLIEYDAKAVVVVMFEIVPYVSRALQETAKQTQRPPVPSYSLPFPRPEHRKRYVRELIELLRKLREPGALERS